MSCQRSWFSVGSGPQCLGDDTCAKALKPIVNSTANNIKRFFFILSSASNFAQFYYILSFKISVMSSLVRSRYPAG